MPGKDYTSQHNRPHYPKSQSYIIGPFIFITAIAIIMAFAVALLLRQHFKQSIRFEQVAIENAQISDERDELFARLNELEAAFQELVGYNADLQELLDAKTNEIAGLREQISRETGQLSQYRSQVTQLEADLEMYQNQISFLKGENLSLDRANRQMRMIIQKSDQERDRLYSELQQTQLQLNEAAQLRISSVEVLPLRERRRGDRQTARARRVDKIQVCFFINENPIAEPGKYDFYFRVVGPGNQLVDAGNTFGHNGEQAAYTFRLQTDFQNQQKHTCTEWSYQDFSSGIYSVSIFTQGREVGKVSFELN